MAAVLSLTACSEQDNPNSDPDEPGKKDYAERLVPVVDPQGKAQGMVTLRFYDDMPNVAYVSIGNFQGIVYPGTTVHVAKTAPDRYLLTSPCGTATVDTANDRFESDDYEAFTNMMGLVQPGMPNTIFDALPMLRWKSIEKTPNNVHVTLDYGKYGIDLRADDNDVYFPFATINDLYANGFMHVAAFNGQTVMVAPNGAYSLVDGYPAFFTTPILQEKRPADLVDFNYKNLCFTLTNFHGYSGRSVLEQSGLKEKGLDKALQDYGKGGQMTRQLLLSENMYDYMAGTATLSQLFANTLTDVITYNQIDKETASWATLDNVKTAKLEEFNTYCPECASTMLGNMDAW